MVEPRGSRRRTSSVIGVDVGGTKVVVAQLRRNELGESVVDPTDRSGSRALIDQIVAMVNRVRGDDLESVGIGVPSTVEFETGRVVSSVNIPLADVPLGKVLGERLGVPVFVDNDAAVAALAEAHDENLQLAAQNLVMLTIGTGVGGGIVLGGRIYRGATGGAGELGHTIVGLELGDSEPVPEPNGFPQRGSLECVASGHALDRMASKSASAGGAPAPASPKAGGTPLLGTDAVDAARAGDPAASRIVEIWAERVGIGVANAINTFDPHEVVIGGGASQAADLLLEPARRVALGYVVPGLRGQTNIRLARHGVRAGVLGAALLAEHDVADSNARLTRSPPRSTV
jgi:glucokinase